MRDSKDERAEILGCDNGKEVVLLDPSHQVDDGEGLSAAFRLIREVVEMWKERNELSGQDEIEESIKLGGQTKICIERTEEYGRSLTSDQNETEESIELGGQKEIRSIERTEEYGRSLTPKEAFRLFSKKLHAKRPVKMNKGKRMQQYQEESNIKRKKNADTPSLTVERSRDPYVILKRHCLANDLTRTSLQVPMLGDRKDE